MGDCFSKPKKPVENEVDLFIMKPRPSFDNFSELSSTQYSPSLNIGESRLLEKPFNKSHEETVEALLSYLCCIFNQRCPNCKKQITSCSRTERQIRSIVAKLQDKVVHEIRMQLHNGLLPSSSFLSLKKVQFATIRRFCHEKQFLSDDLQSSLSNIFERPETDYSKMAAEIIFKAKEALSYPDAEEYESLTDNCSLISYSDATDYGYGVCGFSLHPTKKKNGNGPEYQKLDNLKQSLIEEPGKPICLSQNCNKEMWG